MPLVRFVFAVGLVFVADHFVLVALSWAALRGEADPSTLGVVLMSAAIARAITTPLGGLASDRFGVRELVWLSVVARAGVLGWAAVEVEAPFEPSALIGLAVAVGALQGLGTSPILAATPSLVDRRGLSRANGAVMFVIQLASAGGPPLCGALLASSSIAVAWWASAGQLLAAAVLLPALPKAPRPAHSVESVGPNASAVPWMLFVVVGALYLGLMGPLQVGVPAFVRDGLNDDPRVLGALLGAFGLGMSMGTVVAGLRSPPRRPGLHFIGVLAWVAAALASIGSVPLPSMVGIGLTGAGFGLGYLNVIGVTWLQRACPEHRLGRMMGLVMLAANAATPASHFAAGMLTDDWGIELFSLGAAVVSVACALAIASGRFRGIRDSARL